MNEALNARLNQRILDKFISANVAVCPRCILKHQVGTIWCYACSGPMITKQPLPISHQESKNLVILTAPDHSRVPASGNASSSTDARGLLDVPYTFGNLSWEQRMLTWRKATYKKKYPDGRHIYHYTEWPICERYKYDADFVASSSRMSQQYFQCDFTWEMAIEADVSAWRLWKEEQATQKGKGTRKGQPVIDAQPTSYDV